ncbi:hypothetical protein IFM61606_03701 [Aspergillus udagawae]|nr:hypothetical protein IFM61606_03701 [Aspergillus udagawae]
MADPLTIIGGITAVLDLISFGYNIISVAAELKESTGKLEINNERDIIVRDIEVILGNLRQRSKDEDHSLGRLRQSSLVIATEFKSALDKLKIHGNVTKWKTMKVAFANIWDKKKLQELDSRLRGLTLELNTHITANSSVLLEEMSEAQRTRFETVQIDIYNLQDQIAEAFSRQENKMTAQLTVLKEASTGIANDTTAIQGRLERMEKGDDKLRTTMDEILKSGTAIQEKLTEVERLMESAFPGDGSVRSNELERARDALRKGYDLLAYHTFEKTEATLMENASTRGWDPSQISATGHTYSGTSLVMGQGVHIQGDLGAPNTNVEGSRNLYSGHSTTSERGTHIQGNINDPRLFSILLGGRGK